MIKRIELWLRNLIASELRKVLAEVKAVEAKARETVREAPAHWRADEETIKIELEHRAPKR